MLCPLEVIRDDLDRTVSVEIVFHGPQLQPGPDAGVSALKLGPEGLEPVRWQVGSHGVVVRDAQEGVTGTTAGGQGLLRHRAAVVQIDQDLEQVPVRRRPDHVRYDPAADPGVHLNQPEPVLGEDRLGVEDSQVESQRSAYLHQVVTEFPLYLRGEPGRHRGAEFEQRVIPADLPADRGQRRAGAAVCRHLHRVQGPDRHLLDQETSVEFGQERGIEGLAPGRGLGEMALDVLR